MATNNTSDHNLSGSIALGDAQAVPFYVHTPRNVPGAHGLSTIDEGPQVRMTFRVAPEECFFRSLEALNSACDELICLVDCDLKVLVFMVEDGNSRMEVSYAMHVLSLIMFHSHVVIKWKLQLSPKGE